MDNYRILLSTVENMVTARRIARELVDRRLVACVNLVPGIESVYRWQGRVETAQEVLLIMKTTEANQTAALAALREIHPYEVPEGIIVPVLDGLPSYLDWIAASVQKGV